MYGSRGRSGVGDQFTGKSWQDFEQLSPNGRQMKQADKRYIHDISGAQYWSERRQGDEAFYDIKPEDYRTPSYYHQPKQAKVVPITEDVEEENVLCIPSVNIPTQEKKDSIFLTLKEGNIFRKIYEKFVKQ